MSVSKGCIAKLVDSTDVFDTARYARTAAAQSAIIAD